jgi:hypothetical protein
MEGMVCIDVIIMKEIFDQRNTELEIAAKNTIVEVHLIATKIEDTTKVLRSKEKQLETIDAAIRELDHLRILLKIDEEKEELDKGKPD